MIKPTMSHAVNKIHLNELLVEWFQIREKELEEMLIFLVKNDSINDISIEKEVVELINK